MEGHSTRKRGSNSIPPSGDASSFTIQPLRPGEEKYSFTAIRPPQNGKFEDGPTDASRSRFRYTPNPDFIGEEKFTVRAMPGYYEMVITVRVSR